MSTTSVPHPYVDIMRCPVVAGYSPHLESRDGRPTEMTEWGR